MVTQKAELAKIIVIVPVGSHRYRSAQAPVIEQNEVRLTAVFSEKVGSRTSTSSKGRIVFVIKVISVRRVDVLRKTVTLKRSGFEHTVHGSVTSVIVLQEDLNDDVVHADYSS